MEMGEGQRRMTVPLPENDDWWTDKETQGQRRKRKAGEGKIAELLPLSLKPKVFFFFLLIQAKMLKAFAHE